MSPNVTAFFDQATNTISFVVKDPNSRKCAIVDSVLDFDYASGRTDTKSADEIIAHVRANDLEVEWILETHVHADHLSAAPYLQEKLGGKIGIGDRITVVQDTFGKVFNEGTEFQRDGSQFDRLFEDGDTYMIGNMPAFAIYTPGHTPACMTHVMGDAAFVGDTLFMPDGGSARADFPGGDARTLFRSIQKILALPAETKLYMCHDYKAPGRDTYAWETTVGEQRERSVHIKEGISEDAFVKMRETRDATLAVPRLLLPSIQTNIRAGRFPEAEANGVHYLKIPVKPAGNVQLI